MNYIGIDMSKASFHAALSETSVQVFHNTPEGLRLFVAALLERAMCSSNTLIGVEATGAYHLFFCTHMTKATWKVAVINPLESNKFLKSRSLRNVKTDKADALGIREMTALGRGHVFTDTDEILTLKALVVERQGLIEIQTTLKQRQEAHTTKQKAVSETLHDSTQTILTALKHEIRAIERLFQHHEPQTQTLLRSIPGVGVLTAAMLVAFVGDIRRFSSPEKLVAYIGLDCRVHESGTSVKGKGFLTKRGNKQLRHALYAAAFIARQHNPTLKKYFDDKLTGGKHYVSALCAVERKLIHLIWAVWTRGTPYTPKHKHV
jgi:transposase